MIQRKIYLIRDKKVMLDTDLAKLYAVETSHLNRAVKRNMERFPEDFMFQLNAEDVEVLRCQFGISKRRKRRQTVFSVRFHGARRGYAVFGAEE